MGVASMADPSLMDPSVPQFKAYTDSELKAIVHPLVLEAVRAEVGRRSRQFRWIGAVVGVIGLGTIGTLVNFLVDTSVRNQIEERTGNISDAIEFARLQTIALKLELKSSFSDQEANAIMKFLRKLKSNDGRTSDDFLSILSQVTISFDGAGQTAQIDEIFSLFETEILSTPILVEVLLHHYGGEIVGRVHTPVDDLAYESFEKLERMASSGRVPEVALFYRTLFEAESSPDSTRPAVTNLMRSALDLSEDDRVRYLRHFFTKSRFDNWMKVSTPEAKNIEKDIRHFFVLYEQDIQSIFSITDQAISAAIVDIGQRGISEHDGFDLATAIIKGTPAD